MTVDLATARKHADERDIHDCCRNTILALCDEIERLRNFVLAAALPREGAGRDELVEAMLRGFRWRNFETTESGLTARYEAAAMRNAYNALRAAILGDEGDSQ